MTFDVFIERPKDTSPEGRERLIRAMATRFGLAESLVRGPISTGRRLRAKAGCENATARQLARELESLGAIVTVAPHAGVRVTGSGPAVAVLDDAPPSPRLSSSGPMVVVPTGTFTLATLDGEDAEPPPPPPLSAAATPAPAPRGGPSIRDDAFVPPEGHEAPLELASMPSRPGTVAPPAPSFETPAAQPPPRSRNTKPVPPPSLVAAPPPPEPEWAPPREGLVELVRQPRGRFAAALALGLLVGFVPAHVYASFAEDKLDEIGAQLAREPAPQTENEYQLLMEQFDLAQGRAARVKGRIMVVTAVVWLLAGAATSYGAWRLMSSLLPPARDAG